jgi:hypothetical protein
MVFIHDKKSRSAHCWTVAQAGLKKQTEIRAGFFPKRSRFEAAAAVEVALETLVLAHVVVKHFTTKSDLG